MAYREFSQPTDFRPANSDYLAEGVAGIFSAIATAKEAKRKSAEQFNYDLSEGKFENDQKILAQLASGVVNKGRNEIMNTGRTSNETLSLAAKGKSYQQLSKIQHEEAKALTEQIHKRADDDDYYDATPDLNKIRWATHGDDGEVNFYNRGERLEQIRKNLGGVDTFKHDLYKSDYVKKIGKQQIEESKSNPYISRSNLQQATFWDAKTGKPGVTNEHAIDYINSDDRVDEFFTTLVGSQLDEEITKMKASADPRVAWMRGGIDLTNGKLAKWLDDAIIKNKLINNPSKNIINKKSFGERKLELAKEELRKAERINSKVSVEHKDPKKDDDTTGGLYKNKNIVHSYGFNNPSVQATSGGPGVSIVNGALLQKNGKPITFNARSNPGAGGVLLQKNGKPITFNSTNPVRTNINTGTTNTKVIGAVPFNLTSFQVQGFKRDGAPFVLKGDSPQETIDYIKSLPLEYFDPNGELKLEPKMSIALQGYTINRADVLNAANNLTVSLQDQIAAAKSNGDKAKVAELEEALNEASGLSMLIGNGVDGAELLSAANKVGIKNVQVNEIVRASDTDLGALKAITQGFDLKDRNHWSQEMQVMSDAWEARAREAEAAGYKSQAPAPEKKTKTPPVITSDGSDIDSWKQTSQYKVGANTYYFDKTANEWKKK